MLSRLSTKKSAKSVKAISDSNVKESPTLMTLTKKVTSSMKISTALKSGSPQNTETLPASSRPASVRPSATNKQPSLSRKSSSHSKQGPTSAARPGSLKRTVSNMSSATRKVSTESRSRSVAKSDARPKSASRLKSEAIRKDGTTAQRSASTKKQSVMVTEPASSAKSGVAPISRTQDTPKNSTGHGKSVSKSRIVSNKSLVVRDMGSSSKMIPRVLEPKQSGNHGNHHHVVVAPRPVIVVPRHVMVAPRPVVIVPPRPVVVKPRFICQVCHREIRDVCIRETRDRSCYDCSTRRGYCSSSSSDC